MAKNIIIKEMLTKIQINKPDFTQISYFFIEYSSYIIKRIFEETQIY